MENVYITGHRNPDMDSICSAIGYSELKNITDKNYKFIPVRCSHMSDEMNETLEMLNITPPIYKADVYPKVGDVMIESKGADISMRLTDFAKVYNKENMSAFPIFDKDKFCGLLALDDIAKWMMNELFEKEKIDSIPKLGDIIRSQEEPFNVNEMYDDAKQRLLNSKKRGISVMDGDKFLGYVSRKCFLDRPKCNLILVDHNETEQSIKGIETANVMEIIDHHRLNAVKTDLPLFIDAEPLGSTCTIVYQLFIRHGVKVEKQIAKTLLAGLISDTLILKSPTTTEIDVESAENLAKICGVDVREFGQKMFSNVKGLKSRNPEKAISSDFKIYKQKNIGVGIGQCEVTTLHDADEYIADYLSALEKVKQDNTLNWTVLMITDVMKEKSILLSTNFDGEKYLPYTKISEHVYDMPGVMSRKKQLLPEILHVVGR